MRPLLAVLLLAACRTPEAASGQGATAAVAPSLPAEALFGVCWPADAAPGQRVTLNTLPSGTIAFEAKDGASNSTARCLREIAAAYPGRPAGEVTVAPPAARPSGWAVLSYDQLLAQSFGPERGLLAPAPLVRACLTGGDGLRPGVKFHVSVEPQLQVRLETSDGVPVGPLTGGERCVLAVLGATLWPGTRSFSLAFDPSSREAPAPAGEVGFYFGPGGSQRALDPMQVKEAISTRGAAVSACWEAALARRGGLSGGRSIRLRTDDTGAVNHVSIVGNVSAEPSTAADYLLDACLVSAAKGAHFPGGAAGDAIYSWVFAQRG